MEESSLPQPPTLSDLVLPSWILARLTEYFNQLKSIEGIRLVSSSSPALTRACLYALYKEFTRWSGSAVLIERDAATYALPSASPSQGDGAHALWRAANASDNISPDTLKIINEKNSATRVQVANSGEYPTEMRTALLGDPDLLLIDAVTDKTTLAISVHAAFTGHAVLAGMPTIRAAHALSTAMQISEDAALTPLAISFVLSSEPIAETDQNAYELIMVTQEMRELLKSRPTAQAIWDLAKTQESRSMLDDAREKEKNGTITHADFVAFAQKLSETNLD